MERHRESTSRKLNNEKNDSFTIKTNNKPLTIGYKVAWDNNYLNGVVDDVRIYNRALTPEEVKMLYYSTLWKHTPSTWKFYANVTDLSDGKYTFLRLG